MLYFIGMMAIVFGLIFKVFGTGERDYMFGYKTKLSMRNQDTWNEAQKYSANSFIILGFIYIALGFILSKLIGDVSVSFQLHLCIIALAIILIFDEIHMRIVFNKDGSRRAKKK